jgi:3-hydroxyisobutyrate dehydrogenase
MTTKPLPGEDEIEDLSPIGFVGLGRMGAPMARHLVAAGFPLLPFDSDREALSRFTSEHGLTAPGTLREVGAAARVVITMLPTSKIVREVVLGRGGLAGSLRAGSVVIDMSTSDPNDTRALGAALKEKQIGLVDAPVAGGVVFAEDGSLDVLTGGELSAVERLAPIFRALGRGTFHCGALGAAHAMKALNNYVNAAVLSLYAEALAIGKAFGLDHNVMVQSLEASTLGRNHPFEKKIKTQVFTRKFDSRMALGLIAKDLGIAADTARTINLEAPLVDAVTDLWRRAAGELGGSVDQTEIVRFWESRAGITLGEND